MNGKGLFNLKNHAFLFVLVVGASSACSSDDDTINNPDPISPFPRASKDPNDSKSQMSNSTIVAAPAKAITVPTKKCKIAVTRGESNSSGTEGAVVAPPEDDTYQNSDLLFRTQSTESFVEVKEQVFNASPFPAGFWTFEFYTQDARSCLVPVTITNDDVTNRIKLSLQITFPE